MRSPQLSDEDGNYDLMMKHFGGPKLPNNQMKVRLGRGQLNGESVDPDADLDPAFFDIADAESASVIAAKGGDILNFADGSPDRVLTDAELWAEAVAGVVSEGTEAGVTLYGAPLDAELGGPELLNIDNLVPLLGSDNVVIERRDDSLRVAANGMLEMGEIETVLSYLDPENPLRKYLSIRAICELRKIEAQLV